jgi:hypothetical protein
MAGRVPVHYFEKKKKAVSPSERPTEEIPRPLGLSRRDPSLGEMEPPIATQPATDPPDPVKGRKRKKKKGASGEVEPVTDPSVKLPMEKLDAWLHDGASGEVLKQMSRKQIAELCLFGHHLFEAGRLQEAKVVFEAVVGLGVEDAFPHTMLGTIYLAQGESRAALPLFESAIKLDPRDVAAWVYRGEIRIHSGQMKAGLADLKKATGLASATDPFVTRARKLIDRAKTRGRARR